MALTCLGTSLLIYLSAAQLDVYHRLDYPAEMSISHCTMVYDTRDLNDMGPHPTCSGPMPCDCNMPPFNYLLFAETPIAVGFNITDHSSLDFTITFAAVYQLHLIKFQYLYKNSPINQATSNASLYDKGMEAWVPHDIKYVPVDFDGSAVKVNGTTGDKVVTKLRFHLEWNFASPTGLVEASGVTIYGETQTKFPTTDPTRSPSTLPTASPTTDPTTDPSAQPTQNPTTTPTVSPTAS
eukprot:363064_1